MTGAMRLSIGVIPARTAPTGAPRQPRDRLVSRSDGDGYGDPLMLVHLLPGPGELLLDATDCDDTPAGPGGGGPARRSRTCMKDQDGDGWGDASPPVGVAPGTDCEDSDQGISPATVWHLDADGDGWGAAQVQQVSCISPPGFVLEGTDCDDGAAHTFPGAAPEDSLFACMKDVDDDTGVNRVRRPASQQARIATTRTASWGPRAPGTATPTLTAMAM